MILNSIPKTILFNSKKSKKFIFLFVLCMLIIVVVPLFYLAINHTTIFENLFNNLRACSTFLLFFRLSLLAALTACWSPLINIFGKQLNLSFEHMTFLKRERYRIAIWLFLIDLIICENIFTKLIHGF